MLNLILLQTKMQKSHGKSIKSNKREFFSKANSTIVNFTYTIKIFLTTLSFVIIKESNSFHVTQNKEKYGILLCTSLIKVHRYVQARIKNIRSPCITKMQSSVSTWNIC